MELERSRATILTCGEWVDRYLGRYERDYKASSMDTARGALKRFRADFSDRPLRSITRFEAIEWAERVPVGVSAVVVTCMNAAVDAELADRNPFRGLGRRGRGRSDEAPPTEEEFSKLLQACVRTAGTRPQMRALITLAAFTGMRPGEVFVLEWSDIDSRRCARRSKAFRDVTLLRADNSDATQTQAGDNAL